ncbi:MAG: NnrU family protein [Pseudomonadota bacterium]
MTVLAIGVLLWSAVHLTTSLRLGFRADLIARTGAGPYKGIVTLLLLLSILLIVLGWRSAEFVHVYDPPLWNNPLVLVIMYFAFVLFGASRPGSNIRRYVRHPQLSGLIVWAAAHLLANGDSRALVLFGGLGVWALVTIFVTSRREGAWDKPELGPWKRDLIGLVISFALFAVVAFLHPYFTGMQVLIP